MKATRILPVQLLEYLNNLKVVLISLQPSSIRKMPTEMPMPKRRRDSIMPLRDFLGAMRKQMKGTSRVTSR